MRRPALAVVVLVLAACGGSSDTISATSAPKLVLQRDALGAEWSQFDAGKQVMADRPPGPRFDTTRFGRIGGWKSRFKRSGASATEGPLVVESRLDLFKDAKGAGHDYIAYLAQYATWVAKPVGDLGGEARSFTSTTGSGQFKVRYYTVAWRERNATASVSANGFDGKIELDDVLRLARAQEQAMAKAH
jgi:hypothetical protein